jgi:hypothetical protein
VAVWSKRWGFLPKGSNPSLGLQFNLFYQYVNNDWQFGLGFSNNQKIQW